jgi:ArsR family transcriptional regulator, arsenate/arsenite/antimonite-responsive transcriptional repressor
MSAQSADAASAPDQTERVFKALASKQRREILRLLATGADNPPECCSATEVCACVFATKLGLSAPTVSHHMKTLIEAGLVTAEKRGLWVYYQLKPETIVTVGRELLSLAGCTPRSDCCE